jgi:hypothetical protein
VHVRSAVLALMLACAGLPPAHAIERTRFAVDAASGDGWSARGVAVDFALRTQRLAVTVREARLPGIGLARGLRIECPRLATDGGVYRCDDAEVSGTFGAAGMQRFRTAFEYASGTGAIRLDARDLKLAGGATTVQAALDATGWRVGVRTTGTDLANAATLAKPWFALPAGYTATGRADVTLDAHGRDATVNDGRTTVAFAGLSVGNADGTVATDGLAATLAASFTRREGALAFDATLQAGAGQGYVDPVFVDFAKLPLDAEAHGAIAPDGRIHVERFAARQPNAVAVSGRAEFDPSATSALVRADVKLEAVTFPGAGAYVAPFLASTDFRNATARGTLTGDVTLENGLPTRLDVAFDGVDADDPDGALAFTGLAGRLRWDADETHVALRSSDADYVSTLSWRQGRLYGLALGPSKLAMTAAGRGFRLLDPVFIPIFDGGLRIERLRMRHVGEPDMWLRLDARVEPIGMARISKALGLPEFGGTFSGTIPTASLEKGVLTFGGNLEASVFGGKVVVSDLRLEDPLGRFPRLFAGIAVDSLDLLQVTGTFSFGDITGKLSGRVDVLELFGWQPVRFDARFATPDGDRSKHRISQRAVQNLSTIGGGGGIGAVLQGGVMKFFETFGYDRIGLACRLEQDVCAMSGVAPAKNGGYYIVKGRGLPRIDVIGNGDRVAWSRLVQQLIAATEGGVEVR